jgi:hypothetical protein
MTFIITAASKHLTTQIADMLLTKPDGTFYSDNVVKTTIVHCENAKVAISYSGLAFIDGKRTDKWLVVQRNQRIREASSIVESLRSALTQALTRNKPLSEFGLSLDITGLVYSGRCGIRAPAIAVILNCQEPDPGRSRYRDLDPKGREA